MTRAQSLMNSNAGGRQPLRLPRRRKGLIDRRGVVAPPNRIASTLSVLPPGSVGSSENADGVGRGLVAEFFDEVDQPFHHDVGGNADLVGGGLGSWS